MGNGYQGAITDLFNRVTRSMYVGGEGNRLEEWDAVQLFWGELTSPIHPRQIDSLLYPMLEEALVLRILTHRFLHELQEQDKDTKEVSVSYKTGAVGWLKTQERLRLVMKEILKRYTASSTNRLDSLAAMMALLFEQSEGVLEDAIEFEARKKSAQKKRDEPAGDRCVDSTS